MLAAGGAHASPAQAAAWAAASSGGQMQEEAQGLADQTLWGAQPGKKLNFHLFSAPSPPPLTMLRTSSIIDLIQDLSQHCL